MIPGCAHVRSAWRPWKRAGRWNASTGQRPRTCQLGRAATLTRNRYRISPARSDWRAAADRQASSDLEQLAALQKTLADAKKLYWARQVSIQLKVASAWVNNALGRNADAVALMQEAAKAEETSETHDTLSPGPIGMTAHEALGLLLLELGQPSEAFQAFEASLRSSKNRLRSYAGAAAAAAAAGE
jgi:tetratricopeptide (TPR) repeat protein